MQGNAGLTSIIKSSAASSQASSASYLAPAIAQDGVDQRRIRGNAPTENLLAALTIRKRMAWAGTAIGGLEGHRHPGCAPTDGHLFFKRSPFASKRVRADFQQETKFRVRKSVSAAIGEVHSSGRVYYQYEGKWPSSSERA